MLIWAAVFGFIVAFASARAAYRVGYWRGWDAAINRVINKLDAAEWEKTFPEMREGDDGA